MIPRFIDALCENAQFSTAVEWCETDAERLYVHTEAEQHYHDRDDTKAATHYDSYHAIADDMVSSAAVEEFEIDDGTIVVYCGDWVGYHTFHDDGSVALIGDYLHEPTDVSVAHTCPDEQGLESAARRGFNTEPADAAARATWRRSRL